jgi:hypothetical protein
MATRLEDRFDIAYMLVQSEKTKYICLFKTIATAAGRAAKVPQALMDKAHQAIF